MQHISDINYLCKIQLGHLHWRPAGAVDAEEDGLQVLGLEGLVDERPRRLEVDLALARRVGLLGHDDAVQPDHGDARLLEGVAHGELLILYQYL